MMIKRSLIFTCFLIHSYTLMSQPGLIWEITHPDISTPSYLMGTIHMIPKEDFYIPDTIKSLFYGCDKVVLEIDMDDPKLLPDMQQAMFLKDSTTIYDILDENDLETLSQFFRDSLNTSLEQVQKFKPFFLSQFILPKLIGKPTASYESTLLFMAISNNKEILGLETIDEINSIIDKVPYDKQAEMVLETIEEWDENVRQIYQLIEAYKKMDIKKVYEELSKTSKEYMDFNQLFLVDRNNMWLPRLETLIQEQSCFIAVGALHLEGENGLVNMLSNNGYTISPVPVKQHVRN